MDVPALPISPDVSLSIRWLAVLSRASPSPCAPLKLGRQAVGEGFRVRLFAPNEKSLKTFD
ncbi:MAG TPA: hypothetical protein VFF57_01345 [Hanamia sp.]|nr:hypothetical protein [Hanamia sp.]